MKYYRIQYKLLIYVSIILYNDIKIKLFNILLELVIRKNVYDLKISPIISILILQFSETIGRKNIGL